MSNARNIASIAGEDVLNASNEIVPVYACRAWVNFNGTLDENENIDGSLTTGENVYIRDAANVSSVYFNGTGDYIINFATPMPDENYSVVCCGSMESSNVRGGSSVGPRGNSSFNNAANSYSTSSIRILSVIYGTPSLNPTLLDLDVVNVTIFR